MIHFSEYNISALPKAAEGEKISPLIFSFDIETTSVFYGADNKAETFDFSKPADYYTEKKKAALCYVWQMSVDGVAVYGRQLAEWVTFVHAIRAHVGADIFIAVHNFSFEFQFIKNFFEWEWVMAREVRKPFAARTIGGIEFRCTYALTNMSLAALADSFRTEHKKLKGDLDYLKMRTPLTPLTVEELSYCENDVLILHDFVKSFGVPLAELPFTQTGFVRREVRKKMGWSVCRANAKKNEVNPSIFRMLNNAYAGGYTHANVNFSGKIVENLVSYDFSSSYPYTMLSEKFPSGRFFQMGAYSFEQFEKDCAERHFDRLYAFIWDVTFYDIVSEKENTFISASKCRYVEGGVFDNGRVMSADVLRVVMCDVDMDVLRKCYTFDRAVFNNVLCAPKQYLPRALWEYTLELYTKKTTLKGIEGEEDNYLRCKQFVNSLYGMCVTNTIRPDVIFEGHEWKAAKELTEGEIKEKLLDNVQRGFLNYAVGVWVAAYARKNLWDAILALDEDVVYCDTDSIKVFENDRVKSYVSDYNSSVSEKLKQAAAYYGKPAACFAPLDKHGKAHPIGYFECDGVYKKFKTLGAKKYAYDNDDGSGVHITVAGVPKQYGKNIPKLEHFREGLIFQPTPELAKFISHYDDNGALLDFGGELWECGSGVCLQPTSYTLDVPTAYKNLWQMQIGK